jgi:hypothetical protein
MGSRIFRSLSMVAMLGVLGVTAQASASLRMPDGLYVVEAFHRLPTGDSQVGGCMIVSNNGFDSVPSLYYWGRAFQGWGNCGLSNNRQTVLQNRQAVWQVTTITASNGQQAYVIKSQVDGRCLIRGNNGYAGHPSLHLWTEHPGGNAAFCGFRTADELLRNGQAAWSMDTAGFWGGEIVYSLWTTQPVKGFLAFSPMPPVFPNTANRFTFASFANGTDPWWYFFVRMDP